VSGGKWRPWGVLVAIAAIYLTVQVFPLLGSDPATGWPRSHQNDFKHIYLGALLIGSGQNPYDPEGMRAAAALFASEDPRFRTILPYVYLPFTGLTLWPLTRLSFPQAVAVWQLMNHAFIIAGLWLAAAGAGWRWEWRSVALAGGMVALNTTVFRQNTAGQLNAALLFGYALVFFGLRRRWSPCWIGLCAAFLALFKLTPGILLIWFLLTRRWREAAWMAGWGAALLAASVAVAGLGTHLDFLPVLQQMGYGQSTWSEYGQTFWRDPYNQSPNALFHRLLVPGEGVHAWAEFPPSVANGLTWAAALAILGGFAAGCLSTGRRRDPPNLTAGDSASYALAILASLLIPSICWDHYLVQALIPCILLWPHGSARSSFAGRAIVLVVVVLFSLTVAFDAGWVGFWFSPWVGIQGPQGSPLFMSLKLYPVILLFCLALRQCISGLGGTGIPGESAGDRVGTAECA